MDIEKSKENIQPLKGGRNLSQLGTALQAQSDLEAQRRLMNEKEEHEALIRNYNGPDPLEPWFCYIQWIEQCFPKHGHEGHIDRLIKDCLQRFEKDERYKQDRRFVKLWIKYIDYLSDPMEVYQLIYNNGIGTKCSELYRAWACYCQEACDYKRAMRVFERGLSANAQPRDELEEAYVAFQMFFARRALLDDSPSRRRGESELSEARAALTSLRGVKRRGEGEGERAPQLRVGTALLSRRPGLLPQGAAPQRPNAPLPVFQDAVAGPREARAAAGAAGGSLVLACAAEEQNREAGLWGAHSLALLPRPAPAPYAPTPFPLYEDEGVVLSVNHKPFCMDDLTAFKVPLCIPDPDDDTKIPHYCKASVYAESTEFSLEEIRAKKLVEKRRGAGSPVLYCNLDSQELTSPGRSAQVLNDYKDSLVAHALSDSITVDTRELIRKAFNDDESTVEPIVQPFVPTFDILEDPSMMMIHNIHNKQSVTDNAPTPMDVPMETNHLQPHVNNDIRPVLMNAVAGSVMPGNETRLLNETCHTQMFIVSNGNASTPNTSQFKKPCGQRQGQVQAQAPPGRVSDIIGLSDILETTEYKSSSSSGRGFSNATDSQGTLSQHLMMNANHTGHRFQQHPQANGYQHQNVNAVRTGQNAQNPKDALDVHQPHHQPVAHHNVNHSHVQLQNPRQNPHQFHAARLAAHAQQSPQRVVHPNHIIQQHNRHYQMPDRAQHQHQMQQQQHVHPHAQQQQQNFQVHPQAQQHPHAQQHVHMQNEHRQTQVQQQRQYGEWGYRQSESFANSPQQRANGEVAPTQYRQMQYQQSPQQSFNRYQYRQQSPYAAERTQQYPPEQSFELQAASYAARVPAVDERVAPVPDAYNGSVQLSFAAAAARSPAPAPTPAPPARPARAEPAAGFSDSFLSFISRADSKDGDSNSPNISQKMHRNLYVSSPEQSRTPSAPAPDAAEARLAEADASKRQLDFEPQADCVSSDEAEGDDSSDSEGAPPSEPRDEEESSSEPRAAADSRSDAAVETRDIPRPAAVHFPDPIDPFAKNLCDALLEYVRFPNRTHLDGYCEADFLPKPQQNTLLTATGHRFAVEKQIGNGTFGSVYRGVDLSTNVPVALKYQKPGHPWEFYVCREIKARVKDPYALPGYVDFGPAFFSDRASIFVSELSQYGSLLDVANKIKVTTSKCITEPIVMLLTCEILSIMHHLHKSQIIHADIKPDNFLLMKIPTMEWRSPSLQLIDLGCAIDMSLFPEGTTFTKVISTDGFTCGEMRSGRPWTYQTDLYCIAGTIHVLLFGSYMKVALKHDKFCLERKWPRYMNEPMWVNLFSTLLNVKNCWSQPDLMELKMDVESALRLKDSLLTSQLRTFANILKSR